MLTEYEVPSRTKRVILNGMLWLACVAVSVLLVGGSMAMFATMLYGVQG